MLLLTALQQAPAAEVEVGGTRTFRAEVRDADGRSIDGVDVGWIVPEADVAIVDEATGSATVSDLNSGLWIARLQHGALVP